MKTLRLRSSSIGPRAVLLLAATAVLLLVARPAQANVNDIYVDANTTSWGSAVASLTWSHTIASHANRILVVRVAADAAETVASVTYGGAALTQSGAHVNAANHGNVEIWYLIAPAVGTANVVVTMTNSPSVTAAATSLYNVDQIDPIGGFFSIDGHDTSPDTLTVTTGVRDVLLDVISVEKAGVSIAAASSQTEEMNILTGNGGNDLIGGASIRAGGTSVAMTWTQNHAQDWTLAAVSVRMPTLASPVTQDALSSSSGTALTSLTWSHTVGAGANRYLLVRVAVGGVTTVSSVTYGGVALTFIGRKQGTSNTVEMWGLAAPTAGTANVVVTVPSAAGIVASAVSVFNVDQTSPTEPIATASGSSATPSVTATANDGELVYGVLGVVQSATTITTAAGQTQDFKVHTGAGASDGWGGGSHKAGAPSTVMSWTINAALSWAQAAIGLRPASLVTVDNTATAATTGATSLTWSHTVNAGSNLYLLVRVALHGTTQTISTVTYGGTALGYIGRMHGTRDSVEMWGLVGPTVGSANVVVTPSASLAMEAASTSYSNVNRFNPYEGFITASGTSTVPSLAVSNFGEDLVVDVLAVDPTTSSVTVAAAQTQAFSAATGATATDVWGAGSREEGAASTTMSWTLGTAKAWAQAALALRPATSATAGRLAGGAALRHGGEVSLRWSSPTEHDTLGYYVERDDGDGAGPTRLGASLVRGGSLSVGAVNPGHVFRDTAPGDASVYWIVEVALDGRRHRHGPFVPAPSDTSHTSDAWGTSDTSENGRPATRPTRIAPPLAGDYGHPLARVAPPWRAPAPDASPGAPDLGSLPSVKLLVRSEGWYRVGQPALVAAGVDPATTDPRRLHLYAGSVEQAIRVVGEEDGRLDAADAVEFYGLGLDTPSTATRAYWLVARPELGRRIARVPLAGLPASGEASFTATVERRDRSLYFAALHNGDGDNFFGPVVSNVAADQSLAVASSDPDAAATLAVSLQGASAGTHAVSVSLGASVLGVMRFADRQHIESRFSLPAGTLSDGIEAVTLSTSSSLDVSVVDSVRLRYGRRYLASGGSLGCSATGGARTTLSAFPSSDVRVFDVTDADAPVELQAEVRASGRAFDVFIEPPGVGSRALLALVDAAWSSPLAVLAHRPASLRASPGADLVLVAHHDFVSALGPLARLRESEGLSTMTVDVADIYDELSGGEPSAAALREFFRACLRWPRAPRWALLAGDASVDPRDFLGKGSFDFVPTKIIDTQALKTASDDWLTDFDGDGAGDLPLGRLPARTAADAALMVAKIVAHRPLLPAEPGAALLLADQAGTLDFPRATRSVAAGLESEFAVEMLTRGTPGVDVPAALRARLRGDLDLVNYYGHGSVEDWAGLLRSADARALHSDGRLPVVVAMTCLNGFFHDVYSDSLAKALLLARGGGAVAVWASSTLADQSAQAALDRAFLRLVATATLGEAAMQAKREVGDSDLRRTWILFGDPSMRVRTGGPVDADAWPRPDAGTDASETPAPRSGCDLTPGPRRAPLPWALLLLALVAACAATARRRARAR